MLLYSNMVGETIHTCQSFNRKLNRRCYLPQSISTPIIILNTRNVAHELLDVRGAIYADRPKFTMAGEL